MAHSGRLTTPEAFPPHPPLVSGGWYRELVRGEVVGPGRYPVENRSVRAAVGWGLLLGPLGICSVSVTAGLVAVGVAALLVVLFGFGALLVIWPLAVVAAGVGVRLRQ